MEARRVDGGPWHCRGRRKRRPASPVSGAVATEASTVGTSVQAPEGPLTRQEVPLRGSRTVGAVALFGVGLGAQAFFRYIWLVRTGRRRGRVTKSEQSPQPICGNSRPFS